MTTTHKINFKKFIKLSIKTQLLNWLHDNSILDNSNSDYSNSDNSNSEAISPNIIWNWKIIKTCQPEEINKKNVKIKLLKKILYNF